MTQYNVYKIYEIILYFVPKIADNILYKILWFFDNLALFVVAIVRDNKGKNS